MLVAYVTTLYCKWQSCVGTDLIHLLLIHWACSQAVYLNNSLNGRQYVRRGENITFECVTAGSSILAWSSDEYINARGDRIEFLVVHNNGTIIMAPNSYTLAKLIGVYTDEDRQPVIVSQLSIIVQRTIPHFSVSCHHVGSGLTKTVTLQLSGKFTLCQEITCKLTGMFYWY